MALSSILKTSFLLVGTLIVCLRFSYCTKSFPDRLHCASSLYFRENPTSDLKYYNVDEYVNLKEGRSSLAVEESKIAEVKIYYNQVSPAGYGSRKFLLYNPADWRCRSQVISDWLFAMMRRVAVHLCDLQDLKREIVDVPIGPSTMLFAVENNAPKFKYVASIFSMTRLSNMDVYSYSCDYHTLGGSWKLLLIVHVPSRLNLKQDVSYGDSIEKYLGDVAGGAANMAMIGACLQSNSSATNGYYLDTTKLDEDNFCEQEDILFVIRYNIISEFRPGSLVGSSLVELNQEFDFHREPFVQPIGIGCWGSSNDEVDDGDSDSSKPEVAPFWERSMSKLVVSQMSAQFVTTRGPGGVSYVAYDRKRHLLRLDQNGRKNIYDLLKRRSYHVGEFAQMSGPSEAYISNESEGSLREKCVVFDIDQKVESGPGGNGTKTKDKQIVWASLLGGEGRVEEEESSGSILERLLGLHHNENREHHLGTRVVDHVAYEVYESEIKYKTWSEVPILLRSNKFTGFQLDSELESGQRKLYVTFYARFEGLARDREPLMLLKFVELWSFDPVKRLRSIVNRVKFLEFSWSLDVEPTSDSQSERTEANLGLFDVPTCHRSRASQARLVVNYKQVVEGDPSYQPPQERKVAILKANEQELVESLNKMLADNLEVSRLNLVDLQVQIEPRPGGSVDLISSNRVVELRQGLLQLNRLGLIYMNAKSSWRAQIKRVQVSRFSLQDCQLDSIAWTQGENWFAHCAASSVCLILAPGDEVAKSLTSANDKVRDETKPKSDFDWQRQWQDAENGLECTVYSLKYSTVDEADPGGISVLRSSALAQTETNAWLLPKFKFELKLDYRDSKGTWRKFNYKAAPLTRELVQLDPIGARLTNQMALLKDLRHTTREEADTSANMNQRVRLAASGASQISKLDPFRHCQLACHMDDMCASFSFCPIVKSNAKRQQPDCVLSSMRLTADRVGQLIELGHANRRLNPADADSAPSKSTFKLNVSSECASQSFLIQRDEGCGLHPRDFLDDYKVVKSVAYSGGSKNSKELDTQQAQSKEQAVLSQTLSLDDCAGLSFERNFYQDPKRANFTYCPMESLCLVGGSAQQMLAQAPDKSHCFIYAKRVSRAYERSVLTHMRIQDKDLANKEKEPRSSKKMSALNPKDLAHEMEEVHNVAKKLWGLSEENCARECNLYKSSCFAFDSCRQAGRVLCIFYSIRSPRASRGAYLPWTGREKRLRETKEVSLVSSLLCDHYNLKRGYFEVRLRQVLAEEAEAALDQEYGDRLPTDKGRKYMESLISNSDQEKSKLELRAMHEEDKQMSEDLAQQMAQLARSSSIHFLFLLLGLGLGCVGAVFKDQLMSSLVQGSERLVDSVRQFRQRNADGDLNELVPEDQL